MLRERPRTTLSAEDQQRVRELAGSCTVDQLCHAIGCSRANVRRFARDERLSLRKARYSEALREQVVRCYEVGGKHAVAEQFPHVKTRSIVERSGDKYAPRQKRFTQQEIVVLARMAGLASFGRQAQHLARPNAFAGSIKSFWSKRMPCGSYALQGMAVSNARVICTSDVPSIHMPCREKSYNFLHLVLWVDVEQHLRKDVPEFMRQAVATMAHFQRWLYDSADPKPIIEEIIEWAKCPMSTEQTCRS